jgi:hypothetical protein
MLDWQQVLRVLAMETLIGHWDGYQRSPNNYSLHLADDGQWRMLSQGVDQTFANDGRVERVFSGNGLLFQRCMTDPVCVAAAHDALRDASAAVRAALADGFADFALGLAAENAATFSTARLEGNLAEVVPRAERALAYLSERLIVVEAVLSCEGLAPGDACLLDDASPGRCGSLSGGVGCLRQ